jgi:hypothetical protein
MSARDLAGDLRQRTIGPSLEFEGVVENNHGVRSAAPFPDEARAGFQAWLHLRWSRLAGIGGSEPIAEPTRLCRAHFGNPPNASS